MPAWRRADLVLTSDKDVFINVLILMRLCPLLLKLLILIHKLATLAELAGIGHMVDLSGLIKGILVVIGISIATGHYGDLERWARKQGLEAMQWKQPLPYFFAQEKNHVTGHKNKGTGSVRLQATSEKPS